ncbi:hypothetical protein ACH5RR_007188 [Cinchona calisaya]|uniref:Uncharacterized protein n=1 Tax=Cinchona calisaya TaxID=153742 RepID=A0ABD3ARJ7_9GENT
MKEVVATRSRLVKDLINRVLEPSGLQQLKHAGQTIGVDDGVGSWSQNGIDAGKYSRELMNNAIFSVQEQAMKKGSVNPMKLGLPKLGCDELSGPVPNDMSPRPGKDPDMHDITMLRNPSGEMVLMDNIEIYLPQLGQFEISDTEEEKLDSDVDDDTEKEDEEDEANDFDFA